MPQLEQQLHTIFQFRGTIRQQILMAVLADYSSNTQIAHHSRMRLATQSQLAWPAAVKKKSLFNPCHEYARRVYGKMV